MRENSGTARRDFLTALIPLLRLRPRPDGSGDYDGVDFGIGGDLFRLFGNGDGWVAFLDQCAALRSLVRAPLDFNALNLGKVSDQVRAPVSIADHSDFHSIKALSLAASRPMSRRFFISKSGLSLKVGFTQSRLSKG